MAHSFSFKSKIRIFGQAAEFNFGSPGGGNYDGEITFYGEGIAIDEIIEGFWSKVTGGAKYPLPRFKTRIKSIGTQILDNEKGSLFLIQLVLNDLQFSIYFTKETKDKQSTQIISINTLRPIIIDSLPGVTVDFSEPIVIDFTLNLASKATKVHFNEGVTKEFAAGFSYDLDLKLPDTELDPFTFTMPSREEEEAMTKAASTSVAAKPVESSEALSFPSVMWFDIGKKLGPATFYRVGLQLDGDKIWTILQVDFNFSNLVIALKGLKMGLKLDELDKMPSFGLEGLGIAYETRFFSAVGFLLNDSDKDQFIGSITIKSKFLSVFGAGAYGKVDGNKSVFIYAIADYPIGGAPFFFVDGFALGFGYNRQAKIPAVENLGDFPLVSQALGRSPAITQGELLEKLATNLSEAFPPSTDALFLAIGVKFNSFKILDGFLLMVVQFGDRLKFDLMGIGTLSMPPMFKKPQAFVEVVMKAAVIPEEGAIKVKGVITQNSYILSKDAKLSGGFAFYAWFKDTDVASAGDFVMTLGGYHPQFNKPEHYPDVPRLALTWYVNENLYVKGNAYFTVTPAAIMLGAELKAIWKTKNLKAAFDVDFDLLAQWKPFYYEFQTNVSVQLQFEAKVLRIHKTVNMDVGADLELWGPDFSGKANIDVKVFGINFDFGLNFGTKEKVAKKIDWTDFKESFLPKDEDVLAINIVDGMLGKDDDNVLEVNPKDLEIRLESTIPANIIDIGDEETGTGIGIYPMRLQEVDSIISFEISDPDAEFDLVDFVYKNVPAALWSKRDKLELNSKPLVENTLGGLIIKVAEPQYEESLDIKSEYFDYEMLEQADKWNWEDTTYQTNSTDVPFDFESISKGYSSKFHLVSKTSEEVKLFRSKLLEESIA